MLLLLLVVSRVTLNTIAMSSWSRHAVLLLLLLLVVVVDGMITLIIRGGW